MTFFKTPSCAGPFFDTPHFGGVGVIPGGTGGIPTEEYTRKAAFQPAKGPSLRDRRRLAEDVAQHDAAILALIADELTEE